MKKYKLVPRGTATKGFRLTPKKKPAPKPRGRYKNIARA